MLDEGIGARVLDRSGSIDVHMVTHGESHRGWRMAPVGSRSRRAVAWIAAVLVPSAAALLMAGIDRWFGLVGEGALFFVVVLLVALLGGVVPAAISALISGLYLNYFFTPPVRSFTIADPDNFVTTVVLLVVSVAVAGLVDAAANRAREARLASQEAELLALFSGSVLRGADIEALLERVRRTYGQDSVSVLHRGSAPVGSAGVGAPTRLDEADTVCEVEDGEYALALKGRELRARDRRVLFAVASQAVGMIRRAQLAEEAGQAQALAEADRLRRSLLSAVSHDLRSPLAAVKAAASSLRSDDVDFSPEDTAELLATIEESADVLTALVGNLLVSSRLAAGVVTPTLRPVYLEEVVHRALVGLGIGGRTGGGPGERVEVDVGGAVVMADSGLLERVLANLVDNALRYGAESVIRVGAASVGERVVVTVADTGPGIPGDRADELFAPFQRLGDRDTTTGVGLGLSVVRGFVTAMGGTVSATDTPGGGLTMVVELDSAGGDRQ